jgi:hypothetical protein
MSSILKQRLKAKGIKTPQPERTDLQGRFKKREQSVLERTYDSREERSKAGGMGKSIFEPDIMTEFGITEFTYISW